MGKVRSLWLLEECEVAQTWLRIEETGSRFGQGLHCELTVGNLPSGWDNRDFVARERAKMPKDADRAKKDR